MALQSPPALPPTLSVGAGLPPLAAAARPMSDEQVAAHAAHLVEYGYVFIEAYFQPHTLSAARDLVEQQVLCQLPSKTHYRKFAPFSLRDPAPMARLLFDRNLIRILARVLGAGVRVSHCAGVVHRGKSNAIPHGGPRPYNLVYPPGSPVFADEVSMGVWLTPQRAGQGLMVLPGSHRGPVGRTGRQVFVEDLGKDHQHPALLCPELPAGTVGLWAEALVHGSKGNPPEPRLNLYVHACAGNAAIFAPGIEQLPEPTNAEEARLLRGPWQYASASDPNDVLRQRLFVRPPTLHEPFCEWLEQHIARAPWLEPLRPIGGSHRNDKANSPPS